MKWTEEKGQEEKSLQMLFMEISRHYAGRCFQQIEELGTPSQSDAFYYDFEQTGWVFRRK